MVKWKFYSIELNREQKKNLLFTSLEKSTDWIQQLSPNVTRLPTMELCIVTFAPKLHWLLTILLIMDKFSICIFCLSIMECWIANHWISSRWAWILFGFKYGHLLSRYSKWQVDGRISRKKNNIDETRKIKIGMRRNEKCSPHVNFVFLFSWFQRKVFDCWIKSFVWLWWWVDKYFSKEISTQAARRKSKYNDN